MLKTRAITAAILIPVFLAALFLLPEIYWALLSLAIICMAAGEWGSMIMLPNRVRILYVAITGAIGITALSVTDTPYAFVQQHVLFWGLLSAAIFWVFFAPIWLSMRHQFASRLGMMIIGAVILIPMWLALISLRRVDFVLPIQGAPLNATLLLVILVAIWIADSAAYFAGKRFGKHKLAPKISPGKTWEGVLGAWAGVSLYGFILCYWCSLTYWYVVGLWGLTVLSIMGDLLESLIKRQANLKDSGSLLPGHGGIMDRIDGLTSSLPLAAFFLYFPLYYRIWSSYV